MARIHFRLEVGRWWLQIGRHEPEPDDQPGQPGMVTDHPAPAVVYHPDRVGFYTLPDETD